jgi:hypothetical protein
VQNNAVCCKDNKQEDVQATLFVANIINKTSKPTLFFAKIKKQRCFLQR